MKKIFVLAFCIVIALPANVYSEMAIKHSNVETLKQTNNLIYRADVIETKYRLKFPI